jgi:hypothetical protein
MPLLRTDALTVRSKCERLPQAGEGLDLSESLHLIREHMDNHLGCAAQLEWTEAKSCWTRPSAEAVSWLPTLTVLNVEPFQEVCTDAARCISRSARCIK